VPGLFRKALAEFGSRVLARENEQVMKSCHSQAETRLGQTLIESVKSRAPRGIRCSSSRRRWQFSETIGERADEAMRPVTEKEIIRRVCGSHSEQDLP